MSGPSERAADLSGIRLWWLGARPRTLPAAVAPVLVGTAAATSSTSWWGGLIWWRAACALGVALSVQIATNYSNDLADGVRGTDDPSQRVGPVRLVGSGLASPQQVKVAMLVAFGITLALGTPLVVFVDPRLALVGIAAVAAGYFYTGGPRPYGYLGLGEAFVFVFFGLVAVIGSTYIQHREIPATSVLGGIACGSLATALLVVNNLRDRVGDAAAGKQTLAVRIGEVATRRLYAVLMVVPFVCVPLIAGPSGRLGAALAFAALAVARRPVAAVLAGADGPALIGVLGDTGRTQLVYGLALAFGLAMPAF